MLNYGKKLLYKMVELNASDLHLAADNPPMVRLEGKLYAMENFPVLSGKEVGEIIRQFVREEQQYEELIKNGELDSAISLDNGYRLRINAYRQQNTLAAALRLLPNKFFSFQELGLPVNVLEDICNLHSGLILVTGTTSSGKSTTIASIINQINNTRPCHIHTIEDPIEYRHVSNKAFVTQREVGRDTASFAEALRRSMREDPDVIVIGEMRDLETISAALTLAETGHLTFATLHTSNAVQTISRIISSYPASQQSQARIQLATTLQYVICQKLLTCEKGSGRVLSAEILTVNPAIRAMIREEKTHQIKTAMQTSYEIGMRTINQSLQELIRKGHISLNTALKHSDEKKELKSAEESSDAH